MKPRQRFFYEAPEDGGGAPPEEPAVEESPTPEEEAWALSRDDWERTQSFLQQAAPILQHVAQQLQQQPQATQEPEPEVEIDPFDPTSIQRYVQAQIQRGVDEGLKQALGVYQPVLDTVASREGEALARAELEKIQQEVGKFDENMAFIVGSGLIEQGYDPPSALRVAAEHVSEFEKRVRAEERKAVMEELKNLNGAPPETPVGSTTATDLDKIPTGKNRYYEVVERFKARQNPVNPVG